jgi:hypothetical protein
VLGVGLYVLVLIGGWLVGCLVGAHRVGQERRRCVWLGVGYGQVWCCQHTNPTLAVAVTTKPAHTQPPATHTCIIRLSCQLNWQDKRTGPMASLAWQAAVR